MMNWFTHAIAWDLRETQTIYNKQSIMGSIMMVLTGRIKVERPRRRDRVPGETESESKKDWCFADLILGLQCLKNCRNLGIMMLRGLFRASLSNNSEESSQIFCNAPKEP